MLHPVILGQVAFAKGIDKSPAFDSALRTAIVGKRSAEQQRLMAAWESGWDAACEMQREIRLDNHSYIQNAARVRTRA